MRTGMVSEAQECSKFTANGVSTYDDQLKLKAVCRVLRLAKHIVQETGKDYIITCSR